MIIGITGGSGCGKTTLLNLIQAQGGLVLDCDAIYHELLKTDVALLAQIESRFPGTVEDGVLNRKKLGSIVFADAQALADLNAITHNAVKAEVIRRIDQGKRIATPVCELARNDESLSELVAIDAFGLFECGLAELCKLTVAITAPVEDRVKRLMARDGISEEYARNRIAAQKSNENFSALCDYTLENNGTREDFEGKCLAFLKDIGII